MVSVLRAINLIKNNQSSIAVKPLVDTLSSSRLHPLPS